MPMMPGMVAGLMYVAKQAVWFERSSHMMSLVQDMRPFAEPGAKGR